MNGPRLGAGSRPPDSIRGGEREQAEADAPRFGMLSVEADELALAPTPSRPPPFRGRSVCGDERGFDEQHAPHQRFSGAQPAGAELVILQCECVTGGELFGRAEQIEHDAQKRLHRAPDDERRAVI